MFFSFEKLFPINTYICSFSLLLSLASQPIASSRQLLPILSKFSQLFLWISIVIPENINELQRSKSNKISGYFFFILIMIWCVKITQLHRHCYIITFSLCICNQFAVTILHQRDVISNKNVRSTFLFHEPISKAT